MYRYKLRPLGASSEKYGDCEVCGKNCSDVHYQSEQKHYSFIHKGEKHEGWTHHETFNRFGHKSCLESQQRV